MDSQLERIQELFSQVAPRERPGELEIYHRCASSIRVMRQAGKAVGQIHGSEEGIAVRLRRSGGDRATFAACTGCDAEQVRRIIREAMTDEPGPEHHSGSWSTSDGPRQDEDPVDLPDAHRLESWVEAGWDSLLRSASTGARSRPLEAWIEVAAIAEAWVADGGLAATRKRCRGWSVVRTVGLEPARRIAKPIVIAHRRWTKMDPAGWRGLAEDRWLAGQKEAELPSGQISLLFNPETSATLVRALVGALAGIASGPVGPAWDLRDDPLDPDALFGGTFDDAGFATAPRQLADGRRWIERIAGPGHYRRASFRDPPAVRPSCLTVRARKDPPPRSGVLVSSLEIHAMDPDRWILELEGALLDDGRPVARLPAAFVSGSPTEWVERCVASIGPLQESYLGVRTAALVFDGLRVQAGS